jgi:hypothetical protein
MSGSTWPLAAPGCPNNPSCHLGCRKEGPVPAALRDPCRDSARINPRTAEEVTDGRLRPPGRAFDRSQTVTAAVSPTRPPAGHGQRLLAAIEHAWATIRAHHAEIPEVVVLIGTGSDRGGVLRKLGHFAARRWQLAAGGVRSEILVAGEGLDRGPDMVLTTLLHEAAHALAFTRGVRDTSKGGRYHNRRFAAVATELGLQVGTLRPYGLAATTIPPATAARYATALCELTDALVLWRAAERPATGSRTRHAGRPVRCQCACPRQVRLPRPILAGAPVVCGGCGEPFLPQPQAS